MRIIDMLYEFDAWLIEGKLQSVSNWTFRNLGLSNFRLAQFAFIVAFATQIWAMYVFPGGNGSMFGIFAASDVFMIVCMEAMDYRHRALPRSGPNPIRKNIADTRAFWSPVFLLVTVAYALLRHVGLEALQGPFIPVQILSIWCFIVGTFFASCEYPPPVEKQDTVAPQQI